MKRQLIAALIGGALGGLVAALSYGAEPSADPYAPYRAIGQIHAPVGQGSGTLIATRDDNTALVLSCRHVCEQVGNAVVIKWLWAGGQVSQGRVVEIIPGGSFSTDLALVICNRPQGVKPVRVVTYKPQEGPWVSAGFRDGQMRYAVADSSKLDGTLLVVNSPFIGGMSGGTTFNRFGQQVAVVVASNRTSIGVSVDGDLLHSLIGKYRRNELR